MAQYDFGSFTFNSGTGHLKAGEESSTLRPQVSTLLETFLKHEGVLLSREELMEAVWPGESHVESNTFFQCMNHLRKALGDSAEDPTFIQNYPRKGYVWKCPVRQGRMGLGKARTVAVTLVSTFLLVFVSLWFWNALFLSPDRPFHQPQEVSQTHVSAFQPIKTASLQPTAHSYAKPSQGFRQGALPGDFPQLFQQARTALSGFDPLSSERILGIALEKAIAEKEPTAQAMANLALGNLIRFRDPQLAKSHILQAKSLYRTLSDRQKFHQACFLLGLIHLDLGEFNQLQQLLRQDLRPRGRQRKMHHTLLQGIWALKMGELERAQYCLEQSKLGMQNKKGNHAAAQLDLFEATLLLASGNPSAAKTLANALLVQQADLRNPHFLLQVQWLLAQIDSSQPDPTAATQRFRRLMVQAEQFQMTFFLDKASFSLEHMHSGPNQLSPSTRMVSPQFRVLFESYFNQAPTDSVPPGTQLFNL